MAKEVIVETEPSLENDFVSPATGRKRRKAASRLAKIMTDDDNDCVCGGCDCGGRGGGDDNGDYGGCNGDNGNDDQ